MSQKMAPKPADAAIVRDGRFLSTPWESWFQSMYDVTRPLGNNGTTANRPTTNLYVGQDYFDTTLGFKITIKSLGPTVWVRYDGTVV
jgi:hypothetical protein